MFRFNHFALIVICVLSAWLVLRPAHADDETATYRTSVQISGGDPAIAALLHQQARLDSEDAQAENQRLRLFDLRREAFGDRDRLQDALASAGYYGGLVAVTVAGRPLDAIDLPTAIAAAAKAGPVPIEIAVTTGPQFVFGEILLENSDNNPSSALTPAPSPADLGLIIGQPARASDILAADSRLVDWLRAAGHATAKVTGRRAVVDHATGKMRLTLLVAPGPVLKFGPVSVSVQGQSPPQMAADFIKAQAALPVGAVFSTAALLSAQSELQRLSVFQSIRLVELPPKDGAVPIEIAIEERKRHVLGFETSYSSTDGALIKTYWQHRNLFGHAESLRVEGSVSRLLGNAYDDLEYTLGGAFRRPGLPDPKTDLLIDSTISREAPDAYTREGVAITAALERRFSDQLVGKLGFEIDASNLTDSYGHHRYILTGLPGQITYDSRDNTLDPTSGINTSLTLEPFPALIGGATDMLAISGVISAYQALDDDDRFIAAGRLKLASILGASLDDVPANRRLYAGGGGSIRGFAFQGASPRNAAGEITGGRSLIEASAEMRIKLTNEIGVVPFVDAGGAFSGSLPDAGEEVKVAVGLGLRYYTPIGPLRLDIGVPVVKTDEDPRFAFYISLGQAY